MAGSERFDPGAFHTFRVTERTWSPADRLVTLGYALDDAHFFTETISFDLEPGDLVPGDQVPEDLVPGRSLPSASAPTSGFERALAHLHVAAGTSYYKTAAPPRVVVESDALSDAELAFHHHLYDEGLREFAVTNGLPVPRPVVLVSTGLPDRSVDQPTSGERGALPVGSKGLLVPIGGGKDSMVLIEAVRHFHPLLIAVNPRAVVERLAAEAGLPLLVVRRTLDPSLARLARQGARNGHVPITAIVSLITVVAALLYGYDTVALAVERSASEETRLVDGVPVNHQYSKSRDFEVLLDQLVRTTVASDVTIGSALRPWSELAISRAFARLTRYHHTFRSCNSVFRADAPPDAPWCRACPKCRFVALMLAPFVEREYLATIFGGDLFADPDHVEGFAALMSDADKPFECVGERRESAAALHLLAQRPEWSDSPVIQALGPVAASLVSTADLEQLLAPAPELAFGRSEVADAVDALLGKP